MKNSIGTESHAFVRDARKALRPMAAESAGMGVPFSAFSLVQAMILFWCLQMIP